MAASLRNEQPKHHVRRRHGSRQAKPLTLPSFMDFDAIALGSRIADGTDESRPKKRRKKRRVTEADVGLFLRQYGRKAQHGHDPNDRHYSREVEKKIKQWRPKKLIA
jgi:hypothetical protein